MPHSIRTRLLIALVLGILIVPALHFGRNYPWDLAAISGVLLGALIFVTLQTIVRLRTTLSQFKKR